MNLLQQILTVELDHMTLTPKIVDLKYSILIKYSINDKHIEFNMLPELLDDPEVVAGIMCAVVEWAVK
jgi:hypothetical protein